MKPREEGKGPAAATNASAPEGTTPPPPAAPVLPKGEKEGQRPTQPVYQIQNRGMGTAAPAVMDRELGLKRIWLGAGTPSHRPSLHPLSPALFPAVVGQAKLLPPERMKHSIKLVDDQMNWCDSAIEVLGDWVSPCLSFPRSHSLASVTPYLQPLGLHQTSFQAVAAMRGNGSESSHWPGLNFSSFTSSAVRLVKY